MVVRNLRIGSAVVLCCAGTIAVLVAAIVLSPLFNASELVRGPIVLNSLAVTYLAPALLAVLVLRGLPQGDSTDLRTLRGLSTAFGLVLGLAWVFLAARHAWQGERIAFAPVLPGEQTTYTVLMVILGAATIWISTLVRPGLRDAVRRVGLIVIGLTVAKALLIDAAGLQGLARVLSFLILGLVLTALAWADRRLGGTPAPEADPDAGG
jgi:uncharacterized membrane protein